MLLNDYCDFDMIEGKTSKNILKEFCIIYFNKLDERYVLFILINQYFIDLSIMWF